MKERPILFSSPMVRAILDGRKHQTRRVVKIPSIIADEEGDQYHTTIGWLDKHEDGPGFYGWMTEQPQEGSILMRCPYGIVGDRLWVRETFVAFDENTPENTGEIFYRADRDRDWTWSPSIFMPRKYSRITLEVTDVRVERVQEIDPDDAIAEGLWKISKDSGRTWKYGIADRDGLPGDDDDGWPWMEWRISPVDAYQWLWDSINAKKAPWSSNPFVWCISFRRIDAG